MSLAQEHYYPKVYLYQRIVQAKLFIDAHYGSLIDLDNIADEAYFSKFHFIRLFKAVYGQTPHQYLKATRIEKAKLLLKAGKSVSETCFFVGFDSLSSFSGLFRRMVGQPASAYAENHRQNKALMAKTPLAFVPGCYAYQHGWSEK